MSNLRQKGFELVRSETLQMKNILSNNILAGRKSLNWHPMVEDFILVARKLDKLGFVYNNGKVVIIELENSL